MFISLIPYSKVWNMLPPLLSLDLATSQSLLSWGQWHFCATWKKSLACWMHVSKQYWGNSPAWSIKSLIFLEILSQSTLKMVDFTNIQYWHCIIIFPTNCRLFKDKFLLSDNVFLGSCEEAKKLLKMLGIEYISYHACPNDCILYIREYVDKDICLKCGHHGYHK